MPAAPPALADLARTMLADALAAEVVTALRGAGIEPLLLKGPALAERLYAPEPRPYVDADLLVAPGEHAAAERVLAGLGLERDERDWATGAEHDAPWRRPGEPASVDLHRFPPGADRVDPAVVWRALARRGVTRTVPGSDVPVRTLDDPGLALVVALHVAHHLGDGSDAGRPAEDLARALRLIAPRAWRRSAWLAARLRCSAPFAAGLATSPAGRARLATLARTNPFVRRASARRSPASREPARA